MNGFRESWKRAFAVDSDKPLEPTDPQRAIVDRVAKEIARRRLTTPALVFLEMSRPLNFVAAHAMHFLQPIAAIVSLDDVELLEQIENDSDLKALRKARKESGRTVPLVKIKARLGMK